MAKVIRNSNPNYYTHSPEASNCGGFAFNILGWYTPYEYESARKHKMLELALEERYSHSKIEEEILKMDKEFMLKNFKGALTTCENPDLIPSDKRIIAYRIFVDEDSRWINSDFHFKVRINGKWYHKQGSMSPEECELDSEHEWPLLEDDDETILHYYDSPILYFIYEEKI